MRTSIWVAVMIWAHFVHVYTKEDLPGLLALIGVVAGALCIFRDIQEIIGER